MSYRLKEVSIHMKHSEEGERQEGELWRDIESGKLPLLFDSAHQFQKGLSPISKYHNYSGETFDEFDLTILAVTADFFQIMEHKVRKGCYVEYEESDEKGRLELCSQNAWKKVREDQKNGKIKRAYTSDYVSSVPGEFTKDGKAHCYLYISVK